MSDPDVRVTNCGTLFTFDLLTEAATSWSKEHVPDAPPPPAATLYVEHRYARDLAAGMLADGLRLE